MRAILVDDPEFGLCVHYQDTVTYEPVRYHRLWQVVESQGNPYHATRPEAGDVCEFTRVSGWHCRRHFETLVRGTGWVRTGNEAVKAWEEPVPCPPSRGKPTRWHDGRWERLLKRGWVPL